MADVREKKTSYSDFGNNDEIEMTPLTELLSPNAIDSPVHFDKKVSHTSRLNDPRVLQRELLQAARDGWEQKFSQLLEFIRSNDLVKWHRGKGVTAYGRVGQNVVISDVNDLLNSKDDTGHTILHYAARFNRFKILFALIGRSDKYNLDIEVKTDEDYTPLHYAARYISSEQNDCDVSKMSEDEIEKFANNQESCSVSAIQLIIEYSKKRQNFNINITDKYDQTPLHHACLRGNYFASRELIAQGANVDSVDNQKSTALHIACERDYPKIVCLLVENANILLEDFESSTAFHLASAAGFDGIFDILRKKLTSKEQRDILIDTKDSDGNTVLHTAVIGGERSCVNECLKLGFKLDAENNDGAQCIHLAAQFGRVNIAKILLDTKNQHLNVVDRLQNTPLHYAARYNRQQMISYLLRKGSEPNAKNLDSNSPFMLAASFGNVLAVKEFLKNPSCKLDLTDRYGKTALFHAIEKDEDKVVEEILKNHIGARLVNEKAHEDMTPLHAVARQGDIDVLNLLLKTQNCDIFAQNDEEQTPLHVAALNGKSAIVRRLLEYADEDAAALLYDEDEYSNHALHLACQEGNFDVVEILIEYQSNVTATNAYKLTPLHLAAQSGHLQICEYLLQEDAPVDGDDKNKASSPLLLASQKGNIQVVKLLLRHGADICKHEDGGEIGNNSLDFAIDAGNEDVVEILIEHKDFRKALKNYTGTNVKPTSPLRKLIPKMPLQAHKVLSSFMSDNIKEKGREDLDVKVDFNFELLDDVESFQEFIINYEEENGVKKKSFLPKFYEKGRLSKEFHPLDIMVQHARLELLKHPLVRTMIRLKWKTHSRYLYYGNLATYMIFVLLLTLFTYVVPSCDYLINNRTQKIDCPSDPGVSRWYEDSYGCTSDGSPCNSGRVYTAIVLAAFIIAFAVLRLLLESGQILGDIKGYLLTLDNYIEWFIYVGSIAYVSDVFYNRQDVGNCGYGNSHIWELGAFVVLLSWFNLAVFFRKLPLLGIYILMLLHVLVTFFRIMLLGLVFIIGFSISFYMLFRQGATCNQYRNPFSTFLKTVVMMSGEFEFDELFNNITERLNHPISGYFLWLVFVILIPIILANLLVGLAVDDIKGVQETAVLKRLALKVELVLNFDETWPFSIYNQRKRNAVTKGHVYPNRVSILERISHAFGGERSFQIQEIVEALGLKQDRIDVLSHRTLDIEKEVLSMQRLMRKLAERDENIEAMLTRLTNKLVPEEKEFDY